MKLTKQKIGLLFGLSLTSYMTYSQVPTGAPPSPLTVPTMANAAWYRGGNTGANGPNNIFGTAAGFNSAIFHQTAGITRMQMNGTVSNAVNGGANLPKDGFIGIGNPIGFYNGSGAGQGPFSLLHLNGQNAAGSPQSLGYRDWMRFGITSTHNQDLMYIGQRATGGNDVTDAVIAWADNFGAPSPVGPDNMTFNFLTGAGQGGNDDLVGTSTNGREIMRLTATGNVGVGPRFNNTWQPTSTLHQHQQNNVSSWMQITNQFMHSSVTTAVQPLGGVTQIDPTNGFRWGILGDAQKIRNGNAFVYNQEDRHLIFSTNHLTPTNITSTLERMRITSISAPTTLNNTGGYGVWNPGSLPLDVTRVAISHDPSTPVTRPLALLHLGYNSGSILNPTTTDGWRSWMDVGTFVSRGSDNMYIGLKPEGNALSVGDRQDAVISFGDNYSNTTLFNIAPDKLRIIFTSPALGQPSPGPGAMSSQDGLEFVRYVPFHNTALAVNDPRTGFGDFQNLTPVGTINPGNTIEINSILGGYNLQHDSVTGSYFGGTGASGLRFRDLTSLSIAIPDSIADSLKIDRKKVLTVDSLGNVVLVNNNGGNGVGNYCGVTPTNPLTGDYGIPLNLHNYYFSGDSTIGDRVGVGMPCGTVLPSKFNSLLNKTINANFNVGNNAGYFRNTNTGSAHNVGVKGEVTAGPGDNSAGFFRCISPNATANNTGVRSISIGGTSSFGVAATAQNGSTWSAAGKFDILNSNSPQNYGINSNINGSGNPSSTNFGALFNNTYAGSVNFGVEAIAYNASTNNYGLYAAAPVGPNDWAGYFQANVFINGTGVSPSAQLVFSDKTIKNNITTLSSSLDIISKIKASSFELNNSSVPQLNLESGKTYGFIAQNIAAVIPELVKDVTVPAKLDSAGNVINPAITLKSLNYTGIIPFAISGIQELNARQKEMQAAFDKSGLSDTQVKTNVNTFNALATVKTLSPVKYNFTNANVPQLNFKPNTDYGFIAQQLETVYPELVDTVRVDATYDSVGVVVNPSKVLKTVNYKAMSALLVRSVQEQQLTIDSLRNTQNAILQQLSALASQINACCSNTTATRQSNSNINQLDIELSDKDAIVLNQNVPNPFAEQTTITYNVPASVGKAQIIFYNNVGQIIQTVDVKTRGKGKVNVFASDLSSGLYHYTLVADGKVVDSKKMVRE